VEGGAQGEGIKQVDRILTVLGRIAVVPFEMLVILYFVSMVVDRCAS